jgi:hypothetical protein
MAPAASKDVSPINARKLKRGFGPAGGLGGASIAAWFAITRLVYRLVKGGVNFRDE